MQTAGLRRKDTTRGPPLRILSLDGGGVRGYSMLIILQELMHRTFVETEGRAPKRHEIPKPCDHFDLIAGTGTGGLIAIMLGRLRLDVDTCKDVYVRMTRRVFETDKTLLGIPYRGTMFKASKLEEAIRECVAQHTVYEDEGNDLLCLAQTQGQAAGLPRHRTMSNASRYSALGMNNIQPGVAAGRGHPDAMLYDQRENRTKTAVTAMLSVKGPQPASVALLRSYDSRKEPAPDVNCTIWEAGRATCATGLAFKPIQIGHSRYHDDGLGTYNPAPQVLDEAIVNEWPGREVGCFVSIGTGKRPTDSNSPSQQHLWWESLAGGSIGEFAEARRKLLNKIEGCEEIHQAMTAKRLPDHGVDPKVYFRFNVEVGLGDFKMNEWNRLSEISSSTRVYLARPVVMAINEQAAIKLAQVHFAIRRNEVVMTRGSFDSSTEAWDRRPVSELAVATNPIPIAVEMPAADVSRSPSRGRRQSSITSGHSPNIGIVSHSPPVNHHSPTMNIPHNSPPRHASTSNSLPQGTYLSNMAVPRNSPPQAMPRNSPPQVHRYSITNPDEPRPIDSPQCTDPQSQSLPYRPFEVRRSDLPSQTKTILQKSPQPQVYTVSPDDTLPHAPEPKRRPPGVPPLPPKTPIPDHERETGLLVSDLQPRPLSVAHSNVQAHQGPQVHPRMRSQVQVNGHLPTLPYPDTDGPPPVVNLARKPQTGRR